MREQSYSGRIAYLEAISSHWNPDPFKTLAAATNAMREWVEDVWSDLCEEEPGKFATSLCWSSFLRKRNPVAKGVYAALKLWRIQYEKAIADPWMMDAALQTIAFAALTRKVHPSEWVYFPPEFIWPRFTPKLHKSQSRWMGNEIEPWPNFARRILREIRKQLTEYRQRVVSMSVTPYPRSEKEVRDAGWLARYVQGESWDQIAAGHDLERFREPKSSVRNSAVLLAKRIGVTLPKRSSGRRRAVKIK